MKAFWDTNLFIYLWENSVFTEAVLKLTDQYSEKGYDVCTSSLSLGEILVKPFSDGKMEWVEAYVRQFQEIEIIPFGTREAVTFARLRSQFPTIKPPDAIQLSCALEAGATNFVTNDDRLKKLKLEGITIQSLEEAVG